MRQNLVAPLPIQELLEVESGVSVVIPTFNEARNISELVRRLERVAVAADIKEVIFVDDSTDDTPAFILQSAARSTLHIRLIHREDGDRLGGLSGAIVEGLSASTSPWVLVMDGDLQHPPEDIPALAAAASHDTPDIVIASRYLAGGSRDGLSNSLRRGISAASVRLAKLIFPRRLAACSDPMTGFFAVRRSAVELDALHPRGFKVLLELLGRQRLRVTEVPFEFAERRHGASKASMRQGAEFLVQLARLRLATWRSDVVSRAAIFAFVGAAALVLDVAIFNLLLSRGLGPLSSKFVSSSVAVLASYVLNRHVTWRDRQRDRAVKGLFLFALFSAIGIAIAETCLLISHYVLGLTSVFADNISANVVGLALGMVWRYWSYDRWVFPKIPDKRGPEKVRAQRQLVSPTIAMVQPQWPAE